MKIKVEKDRVLAFFLVLAALNLSSFDYMGPVVVAINDIARVASALCAGILALRRKAMRFTPLFWCLFLMELELLISTVINNASIWMWFVNACGLFAFVLILEAWSDNIKDFILAMMPLMELLCYGNYLTILLFPEGLYKFQNVAGWTSTQNWLLGYRTRFIAYLLPACLIAFLYRQYGGKRWREWGIYIVSFATAALPPSRTATQAIGLAVFFFMMFLICKGVKFDVYLLVGINIALFFIVVVFRLHEVFLGFIGQVFEKNITTLSGRTLLWDNLIQLIKEKPLLGYGAQTQEGAISLLKYNFGTNGHNIILHYLFQGGAILLVIYFCMMTIVYRKLRKAQARVTAQVISLTLFVFQIMGITEAYQMHPILYMIYYFAFWAEQISETTCDSAKGGIRLLFSGEATTEGVTKPHGRETQYRLPYANQ